MRWNLSSSRVARSVARAGHGRVDLALERLEARGYRVWSDLLIDDTVIDHVIVGPSGVFTIQCIRAWRSADGMAAVWLATGEALAVQRRLRQAHLRLPVHGLVVHTGARRAITPVEPGAQRVSVITPGDLARIVLGRRDGLTSAQQFVAADTLQHNRGVTWHPSIGR